MILALRLAGRWVLVRARATDELARAIGGAILERQHLEGYGAARHQRTVRLFTARNVASATLRLLLPDAELLLTMPMRSRPEAQKDEGDYSQPLDVGIFSNRTVRRSCYVG